MKSIIFVFTLLAILYCKSTNLDQFQQSLSEKLTRNVQNKNKNEDDKKEVKKCDELSEPEQIYEECKILSGRVGKMQGLKNNADPDSPVTIISKNIFAELKLQELILYADQNKKQSLTSRNINDLKRIIIPKSFQQEDSKVNCFQLDFQQKKCEKSLIIERELMEPEDSIEIGLCFENEEKMNQWIQTFQEFRDDCGPEKKRLADKHESQNNSEKVLNDMAGLDQLTIMERQINSLVQQAISVQQSLINLEKNKEHYKDQMKQKEVQDSGLTKQLEEDGKENRDLGHPETCDKSENNKQDNNNEEENTGQDCKSKQLQDLAEVNKENDIDYSDIQYNPNLNQDQKKVAKADRLKVWQSIQDKKKPARKLNKQQVKQTNKITEKQLQPVKQLLDQLLTMQQNDKQKKL